MTDSLDCREPKLTLRSLIARDPAGGVPALFAGRRASYSYSTRVAIRRACDLLGLRPGDEVLAPAYNCGSELDPLCHAGLVIRFYPVDRQVLIDPAEVERRVTPRTRAIYLTHYFGFLQPTAELRSICDRHGLVLMEDCALSLLSGAAPAEGRAGDVALFCLYKFFPVLAGGVLVINSDRIAGEVGFDAPPPRGEIARQALRAAIGMLPGGDAAVAMLRRKRGGGGDAPGMRPETRPEMHQDMPASYYFDPGLQNARISRLASWPIRSFDIAATIAARRANYRSYLGLLDGMAGVRPLFADLPGDVCPLSMPVLVENRDALARALQAMGIGATPWWAGYNRHLDFAGFHDACHLKDHVLSLPLHQGLGAAHVAHVVDRLGTLVRAG